MVHYRYATHREGTVTRGSSTNEDVRQQVERAAAASATMGRAVLAHRSAVRWETTPWDKGYPFDTAMDVVVRDGDGAVVFEGPADAFIESPRP